MKDPSPSIHLGQRSKNERLADVSGRVLNVQQKKKTHSKSK